VHFVGLFLSSLLKMHGPKNKISKTSPTCFGLQGKPSSGSYNQYLAKNYKLG